MDGRNGKRKDDDILKNLRKDEKFFKIMTRVTDG
jgi:hypothetical protein